MDSRIRGSLASIAVMTLAAMAQESPVVVSDVTVKPFDSMNLVVRQNVGEGVDELGVGREVRDVAVMLRSVGQSLRIAALEDDARGRPNVGRRYRIGFASTGADADALAPAFHHYVFPACEAATISVTGRLGLASLPDEMLLTWIVDHGYRIAGPRLELYEVSPENRTTLEIRVPVVRDDAVRRSSDASRGVGEANGGADGDFAAEIVPAWPMPTREDQDWLAEVADRLRIVQTVMEKYLSSAASGDAGTGGASRKLQKVGGLLPPVIARMDATNEPGIATAPTVVGREGARDAGLAAERAAVLGELDRLMVRGHLKRLTSDELASQTMNLLRRVRGVLIRKPTPSGLHPADESASGRGGSDPTSSKWE